MPEVNQYGLSRDIPNAVKREVRQRSKFGCVICRCGFYQYEHIDPPFENAKTHDPERICCLCGSCHDAVTRGHRSKASVKAAYEYIQSQPANAVAPPVGPLDFHDGTAELAIGGLIYSPAVRIVLRYHGRDLIRVDPGRHGEPGRISAVFTDEAGCELLRLVENEWIGSLESWDIEIVGSLITVRKKQRRIALQIRLEPPGRLVVERLDMRIGDSHVLVSAGAYAVGRYRTDGLVHWVYALAIIRGSSPLGVAIEFTDVSNLERRDEHLQDTGQELATEGRHIVLNSNAGIMVKPLGIAIASLCGAFDLVELAVGPQSLDDMRGVILRHPEELGRFISTGRIA